MSFLFGVNIPERTSPLAVAAFLFRFPFHFGSDSRLFVFLSARILGSSGHRAVTEYQALALLSLVREPNPNRNDGLDVITQLVAKAVSVPSIGMLRLKMSEIANRKLLRNSKQQ